MCKDPLHCDCSYPFDEVDEEVESENEDLEE